MTLAQYISAAVEIKPAKSDLLDIAVGLLEHLNDLHAKNGVHARLQLSSIKISLAADTKCVIGLTVSPGSPDEPISWKCACILAFFFSPSTSTVSSSFSLSPSPNHSVERRLPPSH